MTGSPVFDRIAIIGVGLIGSSIAHAAAHAGAAAHIVLYDLDPHVRERARALGLGEVAESPEAAVSGADAVFHCSPVGAIRAAAEASLSAMSPGAILTDVGGVKASVARELAAICPPGVHLIPGHPIAGTERSGPDAGFATLFEGRWCILTPLPSDDPAYAAAVVRLSRFWERLGSRIELMDPARHDLVLAITSHVPHLIAYNICTTAHDLETVTEGEVVKFSAGGFRDFTRIAASDPTMWRDVFLNNREAVLETLGRFTEDLIALQRAIRWGEGEVLFDLFTRARGIRRSIIEAGQDTAAPNFGRDAPASPED
ncbi:prephenate/arogenate dehydrogenase family protein [bacterium]|nr:prephenate/arogenate dehydrogenase family protein [bacterium]